MSEDRKKTAAQAPPRQDGKPKPEAAGEREDFPEGWGLTVLAPNCVLPDGKNVAPGVMLDCDGKEVPKK